MEPGAYKPLWRRTAFTQRLRADCDARDTTGDAPPSVVRGFSGHWMIFYGAAFAVLYSRIHAPELYRERKCPQGHTASPTARFCSECGYDFSNEAGNA